MNRSLCFFDLIHGLRNAAASSSYAIGVFVNNWAAGYLTSAVVQIIIQDVGKMCLVQM